MERSERDPGREFSGATGQVVSAVAVVIAVAGGEPHATTASSFVPVSFQPPLVAIFFATGSRMHEQLRQGGRYSVSLLDQADHIVARRFARPGRASGWEGLSGVDLLLREDAPPVLANAVAWFDCAVRQIVPMGDHDCFIGEALTVGRRPEGEPLVYYRGRFNSLGRSVAPAPWTTLDPADLLAEW